MRCATWILSVPICWRSAIRGARGKAGRHAAYWLANTEEKRTLSCAPLLAEPVVN